MNEQIRQQFPSLQRQADGSPLVYLDGPAGTQAPNGVIEAVSDYYRRSNANSHGQFVTSQETDRVIDEAREKTAALLGAEGPHTISFGPNMTSLAFALSRAFARVLQPGDEVLITQLDHEANRGPWLALREHGIIVREIRLMTDGILDYADLETQLNHRTRLVCMGYASNLLGTVNAVEQVRQLTHQTGAWLLVDAVHHAPHFLLDVQAAGCDFLLCSAYKFYGPHVGILYARPGLLDRLPTDHLRTAYQHAPHRIETGTPNHAAFAGVSAAVDFIASLGEGENLRQRIESAMERVHRHEIALARQLYQQLAAIKSVEIIGPGVKTEDRAPTLAFTIRDKRPEQVCRELAGHNILAWDGHFYALRAIEVLGLREQGGVTRMGISLYTTEAEIERAVAAVQSIAGVRR